MKQTLNFLGTDSGFGENNTSAFFEKDNELFIIDCGFSIFSTIKNKFDFKKFNNINIIVTHLHNDHAGSLGQIILYLFFTHKIKPIIISKCEYIKNYLDITGTPESSYTLVDNHPNIEFIKTIHSEFLDSYGLKLTINDIKIIYTGDTAELSAFMPHISDISEFYVDVSKGGIVHLQIDDILGKLLEIKNMNIDIFLMHLDDKNYIMNATNNSFNLAI